MDTSSDTNKTFQKLERRLASVSGIARLLSFLHGIGDVLIVFFGFFLFSFLTDFLIADLPPLVRQIIFAAGLSAIIYTFWIAVVRPQLHSLSTRDIAVELESIYPELNDRLISALDLKYQIDDNSKISSRMIETLIQDLDRAISRLKPFRIFSFNTLLKRFGTGLLCITLFTLFLWSFPEEGNTWLVRLIGKNTQWPQATRITLQTSDRIKVVEGNDFTVKAAIDPTSKRIPNTARIRVLQDNGPSKNIEMNKASSNSNKPVFVHKFQNVQESFRYVVYAGDGKTRTGQVNVLERPRITELVIHYDYPSYTGKENTPSDDPVTSRELSAPFDTIALIRANVPSTIHKVRAYFDSGQETTDLPVSLSPSDESEKERTVQTELQMKKDGDLFFELFMKDSNRTVNETPCSAPFAVCSSRFSVKTKVDHPPQVKLLYPGKNKFATPKASIPIRSRATDDYGITSIKLNRRINQDEPVSITYGSEQNDQPYNQSPIHSEYNLDLASLKVESGDTIYYSISATDVGNTNTKPSRSKRYRLSVISVSRLEVKLQNLQEEIREQLVKLRDDQKTTAARLEKQIPSQVESTGPLSRDQSRKLEKRRNKQRSLTQRMNRINNELQRMNRDARFNNLWDEKSRNTLQSIYEDATRIKNQLMAKTSEQIAKATTAPDSNSRKELLEDAVNLQKQTVRSINRLLKNMGTWYNYADIIHEWKKVLDNLKELRKNKDSISPG